MHELRLGVVGKNISYSLSPFIHGEFGKEFAIPITYTIQDVNEKTFAEKIAILQANGFLGCNITVPYKEDAFRIADEQTENAQKAGAANTFLFKGGRIYADNTDGLGLIRDITNNIAYALANKRILICGAGGAVRGILAPLLNSLPASITIANRSPAKAIALSNAFSKQTLKIIATTYADLADETFDLVIDATSLKTDALPLPASVNLSKEGLVYDLKYCPEKETAIMTWGRAKGVRAYDGIGMLVEQAAAAFKVWTGKEPTTQPLIALLKEKFYSGPLAK